VAVTLAVVAEVAVALLLHGKVAQPLAFVEVVNVLVVLLTVILDIKVQMLQPEVRFNILQWQRRVFVRYLGVPLVRNVVVVEPALDDCLALAGGAVGTAARLAQQVVGRGLVVVVVLYAVDADGRVVVHVFVEGHDEAVLSVLLKEAMTEPVAALLQRLMTVGALAALAALQAEIDAHSVPLVVGIGAMDPYSALHGGCLLYVAILIAFALRLASLLFKVGRVVVNVADDGHANSLAELVGNDLCAAMNELIGWKPLLFVSEEHGLVGSADVPLWFLLAHSPLYVMLGRR